MTKISCLALTLFVLVAGTTPSQSRDAQSKEQAPDVSGSWTGVWSSYNPAQGGSMPKDLCKNLTAKVEQ